MKKDWWKEAVIYQIYPRSFKDSTGDGNGDIKGIISKLDYLEKLGINAIWLCPIYKSPMIDNGYDVEDYYKVNPMFGNIEDVEELIKEAKKRDIYIILDIVPNHTSDQHIWFKKALEGDKKYSKYYIFKDQPIEEINSVFGGKAWSQAKNKKWYLHKFAPQQIDLDWRNEDVRKEFRNISDFWIKKGVQGFRFDVIDDIAKNLDPNKIKNNENIDIKRLHEYVYEWRNNSLWKDANLLTVGESWDASVEKAILYSNENRKEMSMVFGFEAITSNWTKDGKWGATKLDLEKFKAIIEKWQLGLHNKGWYSIFINNHDLPRMVSSFGNDKEYRIDSAKTISLTMHMLQGTPYIYQGEEIGMTNCKFNSLDEHNDVEVKQMFQALKSDNWDEKKHIEYVAKMTRDNARTPMQWNNLKNGGFTSAESAWIKVNPNYLDINVNAALKQHDSLFYWYKSLIFLRRKSIYKDIIRDGVFNLLLKDDKNIFAFERVLKNQKLILYANWSNKRVSFEEQNANIISNNYKMHELGTLKPWEVILYFKNKN